MGRRGGDTSLQGSGIRPGRCVFCTHTRLLIPDHRLKARKRVKLRDVWRAALFHAWPACARAPACLPSGFCEAEPHSSSES